MFYCTCAANEDTITNVSSHSLPDQPDSVDALQDLLKEEPSGEFMTKVHLLADMRMCRRVLNVFILG